MTGGVWQAQVLAAQTTAGDAEAIAVPSGQVVTLQDVIWNEPGPSGLTFRFRFVAPAIAREGGTVDFDTAVDDMQHLCQSYALSRIAEFGPAPEQIIISLSDTAIVFGDAAPDATQFFEAFSVRDGVCTRDIY